MTLPVPAQDELGLLHRWRAGDRAALDALFGLVMPWLQAEIRRSMGRSGSGALESMDVVQVTIMNFLKQGPNYAPDNVESFRALLRRIAKNELIDESRRRQHRPGHLGSVLRSGVSLSAFGPSAPSLDRPSVAAERAEEANWLRLALQFLDSDERYLLLASEVSQLDWKSIADELGMASPDAARVRAARLKPRVANLIRKLREGRYPASDVDPI